MLKRVLLVYLLEVLCYLPMAAGATPREAADAAFQEGQRLEGLQTTAGYQAAIQAYLKAVHAYHQLGDPKNEALSLYHVGDVYDDLDQDRETLVCLLKALPLQVQVGDRNAQKTTLHTIGLAYDKTGEPLKALEYYEKALRLERELGDKSEEAATITNIGLVYNETGKPQKALEYYEMALPLRRRVGDKSGEAATLSNIGSVYEATGQPQKGLEYFERALPLERAVSDKSGQASTLDNIGGIYWTTGQQQKALEYYEKALILQQEVADNSGKVTTLNNIGSVYATTGQAQRALEYYEMALPLQRELGDKSGEGSTLNNIGGVYWAAGQPQKALEYYEKALPLQREVGDKSGEAYSLHNIGSVYQETGQPQKALEYYEMALPLRRQVGDKNGEAKALVNSAELKDQMGDQQGARSRYESALLLVEAIIGSISRDELKRSAAESYQYIYRKYIDFLLRQGSAADNSRGLEVSEMARSRALRDLLAGNTSQLPSAALTPQEHGAAATTLSAASAAPASRTIVSFTPRVSTAAVVLRSTQLMGLAVKDLPPLLSTAKAEPFHREETAKASTDGPVVSFHVLGKDLAIFVVEPSGKMQVARSPITPADLVKLIQQARVAITANDDPSEIRASLRKLYDVLIQPVEGCLAPEPASTPSHRNTLALTLRHINSSFRASYFTFPASTHRYNHTPMLPHIPAVHPSSSILLPSRYPHPYTPTLTIVPFGPLFQVPFAALLAHDGKYLVQHYALRTAPSLTVLRFTRERELALRKAAMQPTLFGDPIMPRGVAELPGAMAEVKEVASALRMGVPRTRAKATEMAFRSEAPHATVIHLATHGFINSTQPLLSGVILGASEGPEPAYQRDGFLTVAEVFRLHLNCRLVTLSACDSGLGATSADGVFGLQSAFLFAGSASLLSTLWSVNDRATSRLMEEFYQRMQADPQHDRARALQGAQLAMLKSQKMRAPVYWASFMLTGEAR